MLLIFVVAVGAAVAQPIDDPGPVKVDLSAGLTSSIFAAHWSITPSAVYRFGIFGVGAGIKNHFGIGHDAFYLGPYVRGEIGWFYLGLGPLFLLQQPSGSEWAEFTEGVTVIVPAGFQIPLLPVGPGRKRHQGQRRALLHRPLVAAAGTGYNGLSTRKDAR